MEKYTLHGLIDTEDRIIGAFGAEGLSDEMNPEIYPMEYRSAFKPLSRRGLLGSHIRDDGVLVYCLTPAGKKLYNVRAKEEEEGPR